MGALRQWCNHCMPCLGHIKFSCFLDFDVNCKSFEPLGQPCRIFRGFLRRVSDEKYGFGLFFNFAILAMVLLIMMLPCTIHGARFTVGTFS